MVKALDAKSIAVQLESDRAIDRLRAGAFAAEASPIAAGIAPGAEEPAASGISRIFSLNVMKVRPGFSQPTREYHETDCRGGNWRRRYG